MSALAAISVIPAPPPGRMQRARGHARVGFKRVPAETGTRLADLFQDGCCKVRLPKTHDPRGPVAVLINTAGGITGGDDLVYEAHFGPGAAATVTSQACERIYRRSDGIGRVHNSIVVGEDATAFWLPQETIVFEGAGLARRMDVDAAASSRFTAVEAVVLGRTAMGEEVRSVHLTDHWHIRRDGRLVYADALRLVGDSREALSGTATGAGARAFATVVHMAGNAADRLGALRDLLAPLLEAQGGDAGISSFDGLLVARLLAPDGRGLRTLLTPLLEALAEGPLPRVWSI